MIPSVPAAFYQRVIAHYRAVEHLDFVVRPAAPIPFFGEVQAYRASPVRIVTVGLNPSDIEFVEKGRPADRFDIAAGLASPDGLEATLSGCFEMRPYRAWFANFESVLNGAGASYFRSDRHPCRALHLDVCSPIATDPTWSHLTRAQKAKLTVEGNAIFAELLQHLAPDMVIASLAAAHIWDVIPAFKTLHKWEQRDHRSTKLGRAQRKIMARWHSTWLDRPGHGRMLLCWGSANTKPFGGFAKVDWPVIGKAFMDRWSKGSAAP